MNLRRLKEKPEVFERNDRIRLYSGSGGFGWVISQYKSKLQVKLDKDLENISWALCPIRIVSCLNATNLGKADKLLETIKTRIFYTSDSYSSENPSSESSESGI